MEGDDKEQFSNDDSDNGSERDMSKEFELDKSNQDIPPHTGKKHQPEGGHQLGSSNKKFVVLKHTLSSVQEDKDQTPFLKKIDDALGFIYEIYANDEGEGYY